jgi:hypothetical protein
VLAATLTDAYVGTTAVTGREEHREFLERQRAQVLKMGNEIQSARAGTSRRRTSLPKRGPDGYGNSPGDGVDVAVARRVLNISRLRYYDYRDRPRGATPIQSLRRVFCHAATTVAAASSG